MVRARVHDEHVVTERVGERPGGAVRQREEDDVVAGEHLRRGVLQHEVARQDARWGCTSPSRLPTLPCPVTVTTSRSGCPASRRTTSPPA